MVLKLRSFSMMTITALTRSKRLAGVRMVHGQEIGMNEQNVLNIDAAIVDFKNWRIDYPEDAEALREYGEKFARAVAAFVMDLDALELPQVAEVMARHGVRI